MPLQGRDIRTPAALEFFFLTVFTDPDNRFRPGLGCSGDDAIGRQNSFTTSLQALQQQFRFSGIVAVGFVQYQQHGPIGFAQFFQSTAKMAIRMKAVTTRRTGIKEGYQFPPSVTPLH